MRCHLALLFILTFSGSGLAQQLSDYTHYPSLLPMLNPAYTGTRGNIDARINYRAQWMGFDDAPVQQTALLHSRLFKGRLGLGGSYSNDVTGPSRRLIYGAMLAYHLRFPDVEFSAGIGANYFNYTFNSSGLTQHWQGDPALFQGINATHKRIIPSAGLLLYNDRFHFGLGVINMLQPKALLGGPVVRYENHYYFNFGYNFSGAPGFVWENNLMGAYVKGVPLTINYNLRLHIREKILVGVAWRLRDAVAIQLGYVFFDNFQFVYSYDIGISKLRGGHSGSHEATLGYRFDFGKNKGDYRNFKNFQKQKYSIF